MYEVDLFLDHPLKMTSSDQNDHYHLQSMQNNDINSEIRSGHSISKYQDDYPSLSTVHQPETSFRNDSRHSSSDWQTPVTTIMKEVSIYDVRTTLKRTLILGIVSCVAFLLPFCDTIYLPSLNTIQADLNTTETLVVLSVSIYLIMNGISSIVWGPISDRFGRWITLIVALVIFVIVSIVCIFAPSIAVLIVFRVFQGGTVSATLIVGQATVADIYPAERRGWATGIYFIPILIGPIIGPLIGGALSEAFGWRSTFILLTILSFVILVLAFFLLPETHQYFVKEKFEKANINQRITDALPMTKPHFEKPWRSLIFLTDLTILPYIIVSTTTFAALFISLTLFPDYLGENPYLYSETIIGVLFVPAGVTMLVGSLLGGWLSDRAARYYGDERCPEGRLVPAMILAFLTPVGLFIHGWTFHYKTNVAGPIIGQVVLGFGQSAQMPGVFAYLTAKKQKDAAAVSAANTLVYFCGAGVGVTIAVPLEAAMGTGGFFSLISGINIVAITIASILIFRQIRHVRQVVKQQNNAVSLPINSSNIVAMPMNETSRF